MQDDIIYGTAEAICARIRTGQLKSRDCLEALLEQVNRYNSTFNLVVVCDVSGARKQADAADRAVAEGRPLGKLHGLPITVKESFAVRGMKTSSALPALQDHVSTENAVAVEAWVNEGAIVYGKTNLPVLAADVQSFNDMYGTSRNPWNPDYSTGGSSGGSAGAVAAGFTSLELGTDIAGSIRIPASCCGVFAHKPSYGIIPLDGHVPGMPGTLTRSDLAVAGPFARSVGDLQIAMASLVQPASWEAPAWSVNLPPARPLDGRAYKLAAWFDDPYCPVDAEVLEVLNTFAVSLEAQGIEVDRKARPNFTLEYADGVFQRLLGGALSGAFTIDELDRLAVEAGYSEKPSNSLGANFSPIRHREWLSANERRLQMRRKWGDFFSQYDGILLPTMANLPIKHDHSMPAGDRMIQVNAKKVPYWSQIVWPGLTGQSYLPSTVVPAGLSTGGLPIGVSITSGYLNDLKALDIAKRAEEISAPFVQSPLFR